MQTIFPLWQAFNDPSGHFFPIQNIYINLNPTKKQFFTKLNLSIGVITTLVPNWREVWWLHCIFQNFVPQWHLTMFPTLWTFAQFFNLHPPATVYFNIPHFIDIELKILETLNISHESQSFKLFSKPDISFGGNQVPYFYSYLK